MPGPSSHIMVIAGEASGDQHAAELITHLKALNPSLTFSGLGGQRMKAAGVDIYFDMTELAVVGFVEVLKHYRDFRRLFQLVLNKARDQKPQAVILVDYPGFNLRLARELKKTGIKIIYYISPQVWAWKESRIKLIKTCVDRMIVFFEFEVDFYACRGYRVFHAGHPLLDAAVPRVNAKTFLSSLGLEGSEPVIALLPGSRRKEVEKILPLLLASARIIHSQKPGARFLILKANTIDNELITPHLKDLPFPVNVVSDYYTALQACDCALVASGTATLETAIMNKPMVVVYKTSLITWALAKLFVKIPCIGLVNVVAGRKIVPECVQFDATPEKIAAELLAIINSPDKQRQIKAGLTAVKQALGAPGASRRAAELTIEAIKKPLKT